MTLNPQCMESSQQYRTFFSNFQRDYTMSKKIVLSGDAEARAKELHGYGRARFYDDHSKKGSAD